MGTWKFIIAVVVVAALAFIGLIIVIDRFVLAPAAH
jgi:hypothetical protein